MLGAENLNLTSYAFERNLLHSVHISESHTYHFAFVLLSMHKPNKNLYLNHLSFFFFKWMFLLLILEIPAWMKRQINQRWRVSSRIIGGFHWMCWTESQHQHCCLTSIHSSFVMHHCALKCSMCFTCSTALSYKDFVGLYIDIWVSFFCGLFLIGTLLGFVCIVTLHVDHRGFKALLLLFLPIPCCSCDGTPETFVTLCLNFRVQVLATNMN